MSAEHDKPSHSEDNNTIQQKANELANDLTTGEIGAVLREVGRLQQENQNLKSKNLRIWSIVTILSLLFLFTVIALFSWYPKYRYIPTTDNAAICEVSADSNPRVTPATLTDFAKEAVLNSYSYDYVNYRENINYAANKFFTDAGRKEFLLSLDRSGNLERVIKGRFILRAMATRVPQLEEEGMKGMQRYWLIQVPIAIEFYSGGEQQPKSRQDFIAAVTVVQTPASANNLKGIAVDSIILAPYIARK